MKFEFSEIRPVKFVLAGRFLFTAAHFRCGGSLRCSRRDCDPETLSQLNNVGWMMRIARMVASLCR